MQYHPFLGKMLAPTSSFARQKSRFHIIKMCLGGRRRSHGLVTMIGISYALVTDSHVRVDLPHMRLSIRARRIMEVLGILTLPVPFLYLMIDQGFDYFAASLRVNERSGSATG